MNAPAYPAADTTTTTWPVGEDAPARGQRRVPVGAILVAAVVLLNEANFRINRLESFSFDSQNALRYGVCLACGIYGLWHLRRTMRYLRTFPGVMSLLLVGWAAATALLAIQPTFALGAALALGCVTLFAPAALATVGTRRVVSAALIATLVYLAAAVVADYFYPNIHLEFRQFFEEYELGRLGGLNHPNGVGRQAALTVGLILAAGRLRLVSWKPLAVPLVLAIWVLYATNSRTAMFAAAAVGVWWLWLLVPVERVLAMVLVVPLALAASLSLNAKDLAKLSRSGSQEELDTLTGRTELWQFCWDRIQKSPWHGYGYGCVRFVITGAHEFETHHAHNLLINTTLGTGMVGGAVLLALLLPLLFGVLTRPSVFPDTVAILVLVGGLADSVMLNPMPDAHTLLFLLAIHWRVAEWDEAEVTRQVDELAPAHNKLT